MTIDLILHLKRYTLSCVQVSFSSMSACSSMIWNVPALAWVAEALDARPLRGSWSSPPRRGELLHPLYQDPGSLESRSDQRREV